MDVNVDKTIFQKYNVKLAYLFGSRAKGTSAETSDFDIAVLFKNPSDPLALKETTALSRKLANFFPAKIDIVSLNCSSLLLKYEVVSTGEILYYENELDRIDFEVSVVKEYIDQEPLRKLYNEALYRKILQRV